MNFIVKFASVKLTLESRKFPGWRVFCPEDESTFGSPLKYVQLRSLDCWNVVTNVITHRTVPYRLQVHTSCTVATSLTLWYHHVTKIREVRGSVPVPNHTRINGSKSFDGYL